MLCECVDPIERPLIGWHSGFSKGELADDEQNVLSYKGECVIPNRTNARTFFKSFLFRFSCWLVLDADFKILQRVGTSGPSNDVVDYGVIERNVSSLGFSPP